MLNEMCSMLFSSALSFTDAVWQVGNLKTEQLKLESLFSSVLRFIYGKTCLIHRSFEYVSQITKSKRLLTGIGMIAEKLLSHQ